MKQHVTLGWLVLVVGTVAYGCSAKDREFADESGSGGTANGGTTSGGSSSQAGNANTGGNQNEAGESGVAGNSPSAGSTGLGGEGGSGVVGGGGAAGADPGGGGEAGSGGEGGEPFVPPPPGRPGQALVAGGQWMKSTGYKAVVTLGESPQGNGVLTSTKYRLIGGVVGTTHPE